MKKILTIAFGCLLIAACTPNLSIPLSDVKLQNQQEGFILGLDELKVVVTKAAINPKTHKYTVWGYADLLEAPNPHYAKWPNVPIKTFRNGDTTLYGHTGKWGQFKVTFPGSDTVYFDFQQYKLLYVLTHYP